MPGILNRPIAWLVAGAVPMGAFCAPFLHAHVDDEAHHRAAVHSHLSGHERDHHDHDGITLHDPEHDRAIYLQAYTAVQTAIFEIPVAAPAAFATLAPEERTAHTAVEVTHGHDPPLLDALDSRPPPFLLS